MRKILVVYYWYAKHGYGYGNSCLTVSFGTPTIENIRKIESKICDDMCYSKVITLNIIDIADESEDRE